MVKQIVQYMMETKDEGIYLEKNDNSFECWADADYSGLWNKDTAKYNLSTAKSRTGYVIWYTGCPIVWKSKLQTKVALSFTKSEYICLSTTLQDVIYMMQLLDNARELGIEDLQNTPTIHCKSFEDNLGAHKIARLPKMRPRTK